jgi:hypothetical protein
MAPIVGIILQQSFLLVYIISGSRMERLSMIQFPPDEICQQTDLEVG